MENNYLVTPRPPRGVLAGFFAAIEEDCRIKLAHIGLYAALVSYWQGHGCHNPLTPPPARIMEIAKVSAKSTYLRYLRELHAYGYIRYIPSFYPGKHSLIRLMELPADEWRAGCQKSRPLDAALMNDPPRNLSAGDSG